MTTTANTDPNTVAGSVASGLRDGAAAAANIGATTADRARDGANLAAGAARDTRSVAGKVADTAKGFWDNLDIGKILGGLLGLGGAWFLGNFFGEGIFGTILTICLAFPLLSIGMDKGGSWINGLMGKKPDQQQAQAQQPAAGQSQQQQQAQAQAGAGQSQQQQASAAAAGAAKPVVQLSNEELNSLLDATHDRVRLVADANNRIVPQAVATTEAPMAGTLDRARIAALEAATAGSTGIGFFPNAQNGLDARGVVLPARAASGPQRS